MNSDNTSQTTSYFGNAFTAPGLPVFRRTITGHHDDGKAYLVVQDNGDHQQVRKSPGFNFEAAETSMFCTFGSPVDLNDDDDIKAAHSDWQV
jgi:hypothetical protein